MNGDAIRVVIADDHTIVRGGIRLLVDSMDGVSVVAEAADGVQALEMVRNHRPDVLLADIAMPGHTGLELIGILSREGVGTRVVILSMHSDKEYVHRAIEAGARGYVLKGSGLEELGLAIHAAARGEAYLSPAIAQQLVADFRDRTRHPVVGPAADLTPRQLEVLRLIAEGETTKAVAHHLGISAKTVETHRAQLMERLHIHDVPGLVRYAIRHGLVTPDA